MASERQRRPCWEPGSLPTTEEELVEAIKSTLMTGSRANMEKSGKLVPVALYGAVGERLHMAAIDGGCFKNDAAKDRLAARFRQELVKTGSIAFGFVTEANLRPVDHGVLKGRRDGVVISLSTESGRHELWVAEVTYVGSVAAMGEFSEVGADKYLGRFFSVFGEEPLPVAPEEVEALRKYRAAVERAKEADGG